MQSLHQYLRIFYKVCVHIITTIAAIATIAQRSTMSACFHLIAMIAKIEHFVSQRSLSARFHDFMIIDTCERCDLPPKSISLNKSFTQNTYSDGWYPQPHKSLQQTGQQHQLFPSLAMHPNAGMANLLLSCFLLSSLINKEESAWG